MNTYARTVVFAFFAVICAFFSPILHVPARSGEDGAERDVAQLEKVNSYVELFNTVGRDPVSSYTYMFGERMEFVVDKANFRPSSINIGVLDDRIEAMDRALEFAEKSPSLPIDSSVKALGPALKELIAACKEAAEYYNGTEYVDDSFARGEELHKRIMTALSAFRPLMNEFATQLVAMEKSRRQERVDGMRADGAVIRAAMVEVIYAGQDLGDELDRQGISSDNVVELRLDDFMPYYERLKVAVAVLEKAMQDPEQLKREGLPPPPVRSSSWTISKNSRTARPASSTGSGTTGRCRGGRK